MPDFQSTMTLENTLAWEPAETAMHHNLDPNKGKAKAMILIHFSQPLEVKMDWFAAEKNTLKVIKRQTATIQYRIN